jgi:menaquinone-dependent protoporphyrinogen IX oxidase
MKVLILYHTKTGPTLEAANATAEGIRSAGEERFRAFGTEFVA